MPAIDQRGLQSVIGLTKADVASLPRGAIVGVADGTRNRGNRATDQRMRFWYFRWAGHF